MGSWYSRPRAVVYAGTGIGGVAIATMAGLGGVLWSEAKIARRRIPIADEPPPPSNDTIWAAAGVSPTRPPIRLAMLGDSSAAGYGVYRERDTPGAQLAIGVSEVARRPVHLTNLAVVGARSAELSAQVTELARLRIRPGLVVIMVGANDCVERTPPKDAVPHLEAAVTAIVDLGAEVVVGTCPDLGTVRSLDQPLRAYARRLSRSMAREQTVVVVRAGGRTVSLGDLLGSLFATHSEMFSADGFHPSAAGYAEAARAMLPSALDALGVSTRVRSASTFTTRRVKTVQKAAAQAVAHPGTEVAAAERFGRAEGRRGPFAQLRRRRRPRGSPQGSPETATPVPTTAAT